MYVSAYSQSNCSFSGHIVDSNGENLIGVNVILLNTKLGAASDFNGNFLIKNVPFGRYIVRYSLIGYSYQTDTITFNSTCKKINVKVILKANSEKIVRDPKIEEYQQRLRKYSKKERLLKIHIDRIEYDNGGIIVYSTFTNLLDEPIFVIKECPCFRVIKAIITRENHSIKRNVISLECDNMPYSLISMDDLERISPNDSLKYPPVEVHSYSFKNLPDGEYRIRISYQFGGPSLLGGVFSPPKDNAILLALRGTYNSENYFIFKK